ncbi:xanthine dehydrogenase family protein molybdopterin-binding subunit [Ketobacter sp.]|uniref:xanthine dehydrogenase family protein molybdopterin-binding subunit n=1 Tax=Ketobacter sp. TaxID=2083498 RepID=UPI000F16B5EC|nr:xanthine dehydrogenase family protein molybdopterin-binding subunit [Ketobacter sp.]RLU00331.1 MAG: xanthine dehydrogenase family protein molybdopterin-binding subunit [Ketobacter sp.]
MSQVSPVSRRSFLKLSALAGGGLLAAWRIPVLAAENEIAAADDAIQPNAFVRIAADNRITIITTAAEIGQGTLTAIPMLVAEELDADWDWVSWELANPTREYNNPKTFTQLTAGSSTISSLYQQQRQAGAAVKAVLVKAAARKWGVAASSLETELSRVIDRRNNRSATYGELAAEAASISVPRSPTLKRRSEFTIIGRSKVRLDGADKSNGRAQYGFDLYLPGMLTAVVKRAPKFGARLIRFNAAEVKSSPGVVDVVEIPSGIAVVGNDFWSVRQARLRLRPEWDLSAAEQVSTEEQLTHYENLMEKRGTVRRNQGLVALAQARADQTLESTYRFPYLAHVPMEPLNVVMDYDGRNCEIWCGTQWPDADRSAAANVLGLPIRRVTLHPLLSGGGFGRRGTMDQDFVREAAHLAKIIKQPIKLVWTREDDIKGGYYRPSAVVRLTGSLNRRGEVTALLGRIASQSVAIGPLMEAFIALIGEDARTAQGIQEVPYDIPNLRAEVHYENYDVPVTWMRSVANSFNIYALETFMDELAEAAGQDPYDFRRSMLGSNPRCRRVLERVAAAAGWSSPPPAGLYRGMALLNSYNSYIAQVVEASLDGDQLRVHRVVSAVDCGIVINPDLVQAQIESGVVFGLSSAMGEIRFHNGDVMQSNYHDYPILRMHQTPTIETHLIDSDEHPGGVGELGVPCVAPALANAIYQATGERIKSLPMMNHNLQLK